MIFIDRLIAFLIKAKANTYAAAGDEGGENSPDGAKVLIYEEDDFSYVDTYYGFDPFCGQEVVKHKGEVVWMMNYYGSFRADFSRAFKKKVYEFLQKALSNPPTSAPYRGPDKYEEGDFWYINDCIGKPDTFRGMEDIFNKEGQKLYALVYHGGFVD